MKKSHPRKEDLPKKNSPEKPQKKDAPKSEKDKKEKKIDEQVEESFPASDTPSHVQPGSADPEK